MSTVAALIVGDGVNATDGDGVLGHEVWRGDALAVLVSAMGWAALLKGLTLLLVSGERVAEAYKGAGFERYFRVWMVAVVALGLWMTWLAFGARAV